MLNRYFLFLFWYSTKWRCRTHNTCNSILILQIFYYRVLFLSQWPKNKRKLINWKIIFKPKLMEELLQCVKTIILKLRFWNRWFYIEHKILALHLTDTLLFGCSYTYFKKHHIVILPYNFNNCWISSHLVFTSSKYFPGLGLDVIIVSTSKIINKSTFTVEYLNLFHI